MGFSVFGGSPGTTHDVEVTVHDQQTPAEEHKTNSNINSNIDGSLCVLRMQKMDLEPGRSYKVSVSMIGPHCVGWGQTPIRQINTPHNIFTDTQVAYPHPSQYGFVKEILYQSSNAQK